MFRAVPMAVVRELCSKCTGPQLPAHSKRSRWIKPFCWDIPGSNQTGNESAQMARFIPAFPSTYPIKQEPQSCRTKSDTIFSVSPMFNTMKSRYCDHSTLLLPRACVLTPVETLPPAVPLAGGVLFQLWSFAAMILKGSFRISYYTDRRAAIYGTSASFPALSILSKHVLMKLSYE